MRSADYRPDTTHRGWRFVFAGILVSAMVSATLLPGSLGIISPFLRDDLGISRTQVGALITVTIIVAAIGSPAMGSAADGLGGRRAVSLVFFSGLVGFVGAGLVPGYGWLFVPVVVAALAQAAGNPATNKLIAMHTTTGRRGVVTGIKQSGVQAGTFAAGLVLPAVAEVYGWRVAVALLAVIPIAGLVATYTILPEDRPEPRGPRRSRTKGPLPPAVLYLAGYGALMGFGGGYIFLIPLFAEDALGLSEQAGGFATGLVGLVALIGRVGWARYADRSGRYRASLTLMAAGAAMAVSVLWASQVVDPRLLWVGAAMAGLTVGSWNSVAMLGVIDAAGAEGAGRASGIVMLGFLTGLGVAPTLFGWLVDRSDSYSTMWAASLGVSLAATALSLWWMWKRGSRRSAEG